MNTCLVVFLLPNSILEIYKLLSCFVASTNYNLGFGIIFPPPINVVYFLDQAVLFFLTVYRIYVDYTSLFGNKIIAYQNLYMRLQCYKMKTKQYRKQRVDRTYPKRGSKAGISALQLHLLQRNNGSELITMRTLKKKES